MDIAPTAIPWKEIKNPPDQVGQADDGAGDGNRTRDIKLGKLALYP